MTVTIKPVMIAARLPASVEYSFPVLAIVNSPNTDLAVANQAIRPAHSPLMAPAIAPAFDCPAHVIAKATGNTAPPMRRPMTKKSQPRSIPIASRPTTAVKAYILGGLAWFAIPFGFSTTLGLAAVALTDNPRFPTYPNPPSSADISAGLAAAFSASTLLGQGGAVALLIVLFMAVTSCASAELIAVASLLTFDVYKAYIKPKASSDSLILVSHICICIFGMTMAVFACIWNAIGIDLGWLFLVRRAVPSMYQVSASGVQSIM